MRCSWVESLVLLLGVVLAAEQARAAAPPVSPDWLARELHQVEQINESAFQAAMTGDFAQALRLSRQVLRARRRLQGPGHWQARDTALNVERWGRLARLPEDKQRQVGAVLLQSAMGALLTSQHRFVEAEKLLREALDRCGKALGKEHPETAWCCTNLGGALDQWGKHAQALALHRKSRALFRQAVGEEHSHTATACNNMAFCLHNQGKHIEALPLFERALAIKRKALGEEHPDTARMYNNLASCLDHLDRHAQALPLYRKALATWRKLRGQDHIDTAQGYNNLATCLDRLGNYAEALPLHLEALRIRRKAAGEQHPLTAGSYANVAYCLNALGHRAEALALERKALAINRLVLGEKHPETANCYNSVAFSLKELGKAAEALPLYRKALAISAQTQGAEHPDTARFRNNLAVCLAELGKRDEAVPLLREALASLRRNSGKEHRDAAAAYHNLAVNLRHLGQHPEALSLHQKALEACRKSLGEHHPTTALAASGVAACLDQMGKRAEALSLSRKALSVSREGLGEEHLQTALIHHNLAICLHHLGKRAEAIRHLRQALPGVDISRHWATSAGFDRSLFAATQFESRPLLACLLAAEGKYAEAWQHAEAHLARGLLDTLAPAPPADNARRAQLARLDAQVLSLVAVEKPSAEQTARRKELVQKRRRLAAELAKQTADRLNELAWGYPQVQKHLPADAALVLWLDVSDQHWACVLRHRGQPHWLRLPGSARAGQWTAADRQLPRRVQEAIGLPGGANTRELIEQLSRQRLVPLAKSLQAEDDRPAVRRLVVVPVGQMAAVPVEVLAPGYIVSYAPSATLFARARAAHRPLRGESLLALGDPQFSPVQRPLPEPPRYGLLVRLVLPDGNASRAGLQAGDVLLRYNGQLLHSSDDLRPSTTGPVEAVRWRAGTEEIIRMGAGPLGAVFDPRSARAAVRAWFRAQQDVAVRGGGHTALPGTAFEVAALRRLVGERATTLLTGSLASEQQLDRMAQAGYLKRFRLIHLATHGEVDWQAPKRSALILAQDTLPDSLDQVRQRKKVYDGHLRVSTILKDWQLDADLVVLSACQTGLGKKGGGEGLLGFAQAFLQKGARSVVLSRWKVDDTATALLMVRFYENLLGKRTGLKKAMPRAEALVEAKRWLAGLKRREAEALAVRLAGGVLRGTEGDVKPLVKGKPARLPAGDRPFAHPYYWAAFVLVGDPS